MTPTQSITNFHESRRMYIPSHRRRGGGFGKRLEDMWAPFSRLNPHLSNKKLRPAKRSQGDSDSDPDASTFTRNFLKEYGATR